MKFVTGIKQMKKSTWTMIVLVCGALAACGGGSSGGNNGGGGGGDESGLTSKEDAIREISAVSAFLAIGGGGDTGAAASSETGSPKRSTTSGPNAPQTVARPLVAKSLKDSLEVACSMGGSRTFDVAAGEHAFEFFVTERRAVQVVVTEDEECLDESFGYAYYFNGTFETGTEEQFLEDEVFGQSVETQYAYSLFGDDDDPWIYSMRTLDGDTVVSSYTLYESYRDETRVERYPIEETDPAEYNYRYEYRIYGNSVYEEYDGNATIELGTFAGGDGAPLEIAFDEAAGETTIDGRISYSTAECGTRALTAETISPIVSGPNDYPVGGQIRLDSGESQMTVSFDDDGGAGITFSNGGTTSLSSEEVRAAIDGIPTC